MIPAKLVVGGRAICRPATIAFVPVFNVVYTNVDTVWLAYPRPFLAREYDVWTSLDEEHGDYRVYCTGFMAFLPTKPSVSVLKMWDAELSKKSDLNQFVWNRLLGGSKVQVGALGAAVSP